MTRDATRRPAQHVDAGTTIVEVLVTMVVMAITAVVIATVLVSAQKVTNRMQNSAAAVDSARLISATLDRELRSASCIRTPGDNSTGNTLTFESVAYGETVELTYVVGGGVVTRRKGAEEALTVIEHVGMTTTAFKQMATPLRTIVVNIPIESDNGGVFSLQTTIAGRNVWRSC